MECVFFGSHFDFTDGWSEVWNQEISRAVRYYSVSDRIFESFPTVPEPQYSQVQASHQLTAKKSKWPSQKNKLEGIYV